MTRSFTMHPENPQPRLIAQAVEALLDKAVIIYNTDSGYALGCILHNKTGVETIRTLRKLQPKHPLTLLCGNIAQAAKYAQIDNQAFKHVKQLTPGPYTFILPATKEVPKLVQGEKRKEVGIRIPDHPLTQALMNGLNEPLLSTTLWLPGDETPIIEPAELSNLVRSRVDLILDVGESPYTPTTIVDMLGDEPKILREGSADLGFFEV